MALCSPLPLLYTIVAVQFWLALYLSYFHTRNETSWKYCRHAQAVDIRVVVSSDIPLIKSNHSKISLGKINSNTSLDNCINISFLPINNLHYTIYPRTLY